MYLTDVRAEKIANKIKQALLNKSECQRLRRLNVHGYHMNQISNFADQELIEALQEMQDFIYNKQDQIFKGETK